MKLRKHRVVPLLIVALILGFVPLATPSFAAAATVVANLDAVPDAAVPPGQAATFSISITPDSRTLAGFTLTTPNGYQVTGVGTASSGTASVSPAGNVVVTGASVSPSGTLSVTFSAKASCVAGATAWTLAARDSQNRQYNNRAPSDLSTEVVGACDLDLLNEPANTEAGDLITDGDRDAGQPIQVQLEDDAGNPVTHFPVSVTFLLGLDPSGGAPNNLLVTSEMTDAQGVATFDTQLEITIANVAQFTDYTIVPRGATLTSITGNASNGFDIWDDATKCAGNCMLAHGDDQYIVQNGTAGALLSASTFDVSESTIDCTIFGYIEITNDVIWHEYTGDGPVLAKIHLTRTEMKRNSNNGQSRVEVCVGLVDDTTPGGLTGQQKWASIGVTDAVHQDSDGVNGNDVWVALAPDCPNQSPSSFAPCIDRQYGDGNGGSWTEAWIPGGDPPRRT